MFFWKKSDVEKKAEEGSKEAILELIRSGKTSKAESILENFKDNEELRKILFNLHLQNKEYYKAYTLIDKYKDVGSAPERALVYEESGYVSKAIEEYLKIGDFNSLYKAGLLYKHIGDYQKALEVIDRAFKIVPYDKKKEVEELLFDLKKILGIADIPKESFFEKISKTLQKTKDTILLNTIFINRKIDEELFEELEEKLIRADINVKLVLNIIENLKKEALKRNLQTAEDLKPLLKEELLKIIRNCGSKDLFFELLNEKEKPFVILFLGINGSGKTTTIGKLASIYKAQNKKVLIGAADTFRAAAIEQLEVWAERAGVDIVKKHEGADPAAVAFETTKKALEEGYDITIIDTAGRLHTKEPLINELRKIKKSIQKAYEKAPQKVLLVLDSTIGQNSISQAKIFKEAVDINGLIITKLDGTAKGGSLVSICKDLALPIYMTTDGERIEDLDPFDPETFVDALLS
jgi:fused signal recognition particle receptor